MTSAARSVSARSLWDRGGRRSLPGPIRRRCCRKPGLDLVYPSNLAFWAANSWSVNAPESRSRANFEVVRRSNEAYERENPNPPERQLRCGLLWPATVKYYNPPGGEQEGNTSGDGDGAGLAEHGLAYINAPSDAPIGTARDNPV